MLVNGASAFLYRDYDALWEKIGPDMSRDWSVAWWGCGLVDGAGKERPAYEVWRKYFSTNYLRSQ